MDQSPKLNIADTTEKNLEEARRIMTICNACRYCEGLCPVFPEMTRFSDFSDNDLNYLANLCHNCKGCYHGCQYAEPHQFSVNVPKVFSEIRSDTYVNYAFPATLGKLFSKNGTFVSIVMALSIALIFILGYYLNSENGFFTPKVGAGSFYDVIPFWIMAGIPGLISLYILVAFFRSFKKFWKENAAEFSSLKSVSLWKSAIRDVLTLRHLGGNDNNAGCTHTDDRRSHARRWFHQLTFYGFLFCLLSTTSAAILEHVFHEMSPFPYLSLPVILGTVGGIGLIIGPLGLTFVKMKADPGPVVQRLLGMEYAFISLLFFISLTGIILLVWRESIWMSTWLCIHLGFVYAFFLVLPYSKFMHALYRFAALLKYALNLRNDEEKI